MKALLLIALIAALVRPGLHTDQGGFAKEITGLLELKMMQGSQVEEILGLIADLLKQMQTDQQLEDAEFAQKLGQLNVDVGLLEYTVESLSAQLKAVNTQIADVTNEIVALTTTGNSLSKQLTTLNGKEEEIRDSRSFDERSHSDRQTTNTKVIAALNEIIDKLSQAVFAEQGKQSIFTEIQRKQLVTRMQEELGATNPIVMLVSVTTQFDVATVTRIIERLENIRDSTYASQVADNESEVKSQVQYQTVIQEVIDVRQRLAADLNTNKGLLNRRNNERVVALRTKDQVNADLPVSQELLSDTRNQREIVQSSYTQRKQQRNEEIGIIQRAFTLISQQADRIKASQ